MKILHLGPSILPVTHTLGGAVQRRIIETAAAQAAIGEQVIVYSSDTTSGRTDYRGFEMRTVACRRNMPFRDLEFMRNAVEDLGNESVDVLHFHGLPEGCSFFKETHASKFLSFDYYIFRRGRVTPLFFAYRRMLRTFTALLPVSEYCLSRYQAYWKMNGVPIYVLHNGVNLDQFFPDPAAGLMKKKALGIESERVVLYVGRICEQKGTDILIEAYRRLKQKKTDVRLVVAGPPQQFGSSGQTELTRRIAEAGGTYLGPVEETDLAAIYNACDIFVMPTRSIEMFGMAALEAQACGKPVVCSYHGGLPEVVTAESGVFFPIGNVQALAESLDQLVTNSDSCRQKGIAARSNALRFGWPRVVDQLKKIYAG